MKSLLQLLKREPLWATAGLLLGLNVLWFWLLPHGFNAFWSKNPLVAETIKQHGLVEQKAKLVAISYYYPSFPYFADIVSGAAQPRKELIETYYLGKPYIFHTYYQKAVDLFPDNDTTQYLIAYCDYYLDHQDVAVGHYEKAVDLNPYFFWSYYNLGVIYFQQGEFLKSAMALNKALSLRKDIALAILSQSPFYRQIWHYIANPPQTLENNLNEGQQDAALLLAACIIKAGGYDQALKIIRSIGHESPWHQDLWEQVRQGALNKQSHSDSLDLLLKEQVSVRLF